MARKSDGLVYSTERGRLCPQCGNAVDACTCGQKAAVAPSRDGIVRVGRETSGRKGAGVTVVTGAPVSGDALAALCTELKKRCGSGGTVRDGVIEIQGEHRDTIVAELTKRGWSVKRAGG